MKVVFLGEDSFSCIVLQSLIDYGIEIQLVVAPFYDNQKHLRLENLSKKNSIKFIRLVNINDDRFIKNLRLLNPDLIVVTHFQKILGKEIIDSPKLGVINLHPSLLPKYRGMSPQHWPIINGDSETGISVHFIDENVDTGDIIIQKVIPIERDIYVADLQLEFQKVYRYIVIEAIELILDKSFKPIKQAYLPGSYYGKLKRNDCRIDLDKSFNDIYNLIRAVSLPYYCANIENVFILKARYPTEFEDSYAKNNFNKLGLYLHTEIGSVLKLKDGALVIEKYRKE